MFTLQNFRLIVATNGTTTDLTNNKPRPNLTASINQLAGGEIGISFTSQLVSSGSSACFIPTEDEEENEEEPAQLIEG